LEASCNHYTDVQLLRWARAFEQQTRYSAVAPDLVAPDLVAPDLAASDLGASGAGRGGLRPVSAPGA
jgi:hypothetical protein